MKANLSTGWSGVEWNGSSQHHAKTAIAQNVGDFEQKKQKKCKKQSQERKKETNNNTEQQKMRKKVAHLMASIDY